MLSIFWATSGKLYYYNNYCYKNYYNNCNNYYSIYYCYNYNYNYYYYNYNNYCGIGNL